MVIRRLKCIIIDDEQFMRDVLRFMLYKYREIELAGEAGSVDEAIVLLKSIRPDVVFLDIQLRGGLGFELVPYIPPSAHIIFFTAYDQYAIRAFEVNALDYLLKPVEEDRLAASIERLKHSFPKREPTGVFRPDDQVFIKAENEQGFVPVADIAAVVSIGGNYTRLHVQPDNCTVVRRSLKQWEERLPDSLFFRIHRSTIVNLTHIDRVVREKYRHIVHMREITDPFEVSRRMAPQLKKIIEQSKLM